MLVKTGNERLAETHQLAVGLSARVKVAAAFAAADRQTSQGILKHLLKSEELQNAQINGGMEADTTLVRADCAVELNSPATVDVCLALIIGPGNTEVCNLLRLNQSLQQCFLSVFFFIGLNDRAQRIKNLG